jgi:hypothetical protein
LPSSSRAWRGYAEAGLLVDLTAAFGDELTANVDATLAETALQAARSLASIWR